LKWSAIFPILHEFDRLGAPSEFTMLKFRLAIIKKLSEIDQWPAAILHSAIRSHPRDLIYIILKSVFALPAAPAHLPPERGGENQYSSGPQEAIF